MSASAREKIGFVGLGDQGAPMAKAIADVGFELHVWARRPQSFDAISDVRFTRHDTLDGLAGAVGILALCLRDDRDIWDLLCEHKMAAAFRSGAVLVNHGTGDPEENRRLGIFLGERDIAFLDAPVSGGRPAAAARTLTTLVGGSDDVFERCRPVFESFSRKVAHMGPLGSGQTTKLLNNALTMTNLKTPSMLSDWRAVSGSPRPGFTKCLPSAADRARSCRRSGRT